MPRADGLTDKQARFVDEYLVDLNATQAAIRAGYSPKTARFIACENLTKPNISARLKSALEARAARTKIDADEVLMRYARIARSDIRNLFAADGTLKPVTALDDDTAEAVASIKVLRESTRSKDDTIRTEQMVELKQWDKMRALEQLGKHLGLFEVKIAPGDSLLDLLREMEAERREQRG